MSDKNRELGNHLDKKWRLTLLIFIRMTSIHHTLDHIRPLFLFPYLSKMAGAWKGHNGPRVLTEAQRERKREKDRITKREEKLKTQQKIHDLEKSNHLSARRIHELETQVRTLLDSCRCTDSSSLPGCASCQMTCNQYPTSSAYFEGNEVIATSTPDTTSASRGYIEDSVSDFFSVDNAISVDMKPFFHTLQDHEMSNRSPLAETHSCMSLTPSPINNPDLECHELGYTSLPYRAQREPNGMQTIRFPRLNQTGYSWPEWSMVWIPGKVT